MLTGIWCFSALVTMLPRLDAARSRRHKSVCSHMPTHTLACSACLHSCHSRCSTLRLSTLSPRAVYSLAGIDCEGISLVTTYGKATTMETTKKQREWLSIAEERWLQHLSHTISTNSPPHKRWCRAISWLLRCETHRNQHYITIQ